jgi:hypothetical protein
VIVMVMVMAVVTHSEPNYEAASKRVAIPLLKTFQPKRQPYSLPSQPERSRHQRPNPSRHHQRRRSSRHQLQRSSPRPHASSLLLRRSNGLL